MAEPNTNAEIGKKCAFSGVTLRKAKRYYRDGLYFRNKTAFKSHVEKQSAAKAEGQAPQESAQAEGPAETKA